MNLIAVPDSAGVVARMAVPLVRPLFISATCTHSGKLLEIADRDCTVLNSPCFTRMAGATASLKTDESQKTTDHPYTFADSGGTRSCGRGLALQIAVHCCIRVLQEDDLRVVRVAGRLEEAHIPDLLMACTEATGPLRVDLTDLLSADAIAVEGLRRLRDAGPQLVGVPRYIQFTLESSTPKHWAQ